MGHDDISTTTGYLSTDKEGRARELEEAFAVPGMPTRDRAGAERRAD
jgi:hypothetical protein